MGQIIMSGIVPQLVTPSAGIVIGDLAVGSSVYLNENGTLAEYLIVNQGIPSGSSLYDSSCDGTWLLRKEVHSERVWDSSNNDYANSDIHSWLNSTFLQLFSSNIQTIIKQVKIPYCVGQSNSSNGTKVNSGANGLSTKIFLLSVREIGITSSGYTNEKILEDGSYLSYFPQNGNAKDDTRIAYMDGVASAWYLRSRSMYTETASSVPVWHIGDQGHYATIGCTISRGIRPAFVIPSDTLVDGSTMTILGSDNSSGGGGSNTTPDTTATITINIDSSAEEWIAVAPNSDSNTTDKYASGTYTFECGTTLYIITPSNNVNYSTILVNGTSVSWDSSAGHGVYAYTVSKDATIYATDDGSKSSVIITEESSQTSNPTGPYTVTITGTGNSSNCYVENGVSGTKYTSATSFTVDLGTRLMCYIAGPNNDSSNYVKLNGTTVKSTTGVGTGKYMYDVYKNITILLNYNSSSSGYSRIEITEEG